MNPDANNNSPRESAASNNLSNPISQILSHANNIAARSFVRGHSHNSGTSVQGMLAVGNNSNLAAGSAFTVQGPTASDHSVPSGSLNSVNAISAAASVNAVALGGVGVIQSYQTFELPKAMNNVPKVKTDSDLSLAAMEFSVYSLVAAFFAGLITAALIYVLLGTWV